MQRSGELCDHGDQSKLAHGHEMDVEEAERRHYFAVRDAFVHYIDVESESHEREVKHIAKLSESLRQRLPSATFIKLDLTKKGIEENQKFLDKIVRHLDKNPVFPAPAQMMDLENWRAKYATLDSDKKYCIDPHNFSIMISLFVAMSKSKIRSTLRQCVRDWSSEGLEERNQCYLPVLETLCRTLPVDNSNINKQKVLVPGAGLGRLVLEIASRGYAAQGNEFSYQMLFTSNCILNCMRRHECTIYPYVDDTCNVEGVQDMYRPIKIPDVDPSMMLKEAQNMLEPGEVIDFSMTAGEWIEIYSQQINEWNCVITCFFLDTAPILMEYIEVINNILTPGGIWINFGPLQFHWAKSDGTDERFNISVELSWEEIKHVIGTYGFSIIEENIKNCTYNCNQKSLLRNVYRAIFFVAKKPI